MASTKVYFIVLTSLMPECNECRCFQFASSLTKHALSKWGKHGLFLCLFSFFLQQKAKRSPNLSINDKGIDGVHGIRTPGSRMEAYTFIKRVELSLFYCLFSFSSQYKDKFSTNLKINDKSIDGVQETRTRSSRLESAFVSTEL